MGSARPALNPFLFSKLSGTESVINLRLERQNEYLQSWLKMIEAEGTMGKSVMMMSSNGRARASLLVVQALSSFFERYLDI